MFSLKGHRTANDSLNSPLKFYEEIIVYFGKKAFFLTFEISNKSKVTSNVSKPPYHELLRVTGIDLTLVPA